MDDIFEREKIIAYQNFDAAIAVGALTIGLNLGYHFFDESYKPAVLLLSSISNIAFCFFFRNYLRNFWAEEAILLGKPEHSRRCGDGCTHLII